MTKKPLLPHEILTIEKGKSLGGLPFGYKVKTKKKRTKYKERGLVYIDEKQKKIVQEMFSLYTAGSLSQAGLKNYIKNMHDIDLHKSCIARILKNEFYAGYTSWKGHRYKHCYPTFITQEMYKAAQKNLRINTRYKCYKTINSAPKKERMLTLDFKVLNNEPFGVDEIAKQNNIKINEARKKIFHAWKEGKIIECGINKWKMK